MSLVLQSATGQTNGGSVTLTLPAAPAVGNILFLAVCGYNGTVTPPDGFSVVQANTGDDGYNATWLYSRTVATGDGAIWTASSASDVRMFVLLELPSGTTTTIAHAAGSASGATVKANGIVAYTGTGTYYRLFVWEWDSRSAGTASVDYAYSDSYGQPGFSDSTYGYHGAFITGGVATGSGTFTLTLQNNVDKPVWMDVVFYQPAPAAAAPPPSSTPAPIATVPLPMAAALFFALEVDVYQPASGTPAYALGHGGHPRGSIYLSAVSLESKGTLRASDKGYRTRSGDAGGVQVYPAVLDQAFEIDRHLSLDPGQASTATFGSVRLNNLGRRYDAYASTRNSDGRAVKLLIGSKAWDATRGIYVDPAYADMRSFFGGTAQVWSLSESEFEIPIRDATYLADQPIQQATYAGTGRLAGGSDLTGRRMPMTRGGTAANPVVAVPLITVDAVNLIYQWTDGPGSVVTLYEGAAAVFTYDGDVSDLYSGTPPAGGHYRTNNARGLLQLGSKPVRSLTVDATGAFSTAGKITTAVALARYVLTETIAQPDSILDLPSFNAADSAYPFVSGFYVADETTAIDTVQFLLNSIGARLISTRAGLLSVLVLRKPYTGVVPQMRLSTLNVIDVQPMALPTTLDPPPYRWRVGYNHVNQVQASDFNGAVTDARKAVVATAYTYAAWSSNTVLTVWRKPNDPAPVPTALLAQADAQSVANAIGSLYEGRPGQYTVEMPIALAATLDLGSVVLLDWPLADLSGGQVAVIIGEQVRSYDASVTFTVLATGTSGTRAPANWDSSTWDQNTWAP